MKHPFAKLIIAVAFLFSSTLVSAQLIVSPAATAQELAQKLVGDGVVISNISFTGNPNMAAFFNNIGGTNIGIDSGIVLTSGRAQGGRGNTGVNGDGVVPASNVLADNSWGLPGDPDLQQEIGGTTLNDACVLEFDFVPLGDSIRFNYVFSSEEYVPAFVCSFNDAFAFFISGPGITGLKNIALVPGTSTPVSIFNVNDVPGGACPNNTAYYTVNSTNVFFTHDGHTTVLTALERVQPCQTYHLKLVIADAGDFAFDSGVFLQAKSLSSNAVSVINQTQVDPQNNSYLVEGCVPGSFTITRPRREVTPLAVTLTYAGTALNTIDVQTLPPLVTIPANDSFVVVNVVPVIDNMPEGIEFIKIYISAGCSSGIPTDSSIIQIRDYDTLGILPRTADVCKRASVQLIAAAGYTTYQWDPDPTLNNINIPDPIATPVLASTTYIATAVQGDCHARDSAILALKDLDFISKQDVNCRNGTTGNIRVAAGGAWQRPIEFSINTSAWQADSSFNNLPVGTYMVRVRDAAGCIDSMEVTVVQAFPDLLISNTAVISASCSGDPDGSITITGAGGNNPYSYSLDGTNFQPGNIFNVTAGLYTVVIRDNNGCTNQQPVTVLLNNIVTIDAGPDPTICEGTSYLIPAVSNADSYLWTPATDLDDATILTPVASPSSTVKYYVTATTGICDRIDSVTINVRPAPVANAGPDVPICSGKTVQLHGSGGVEFEWTPALYFLTSSTIQDPVVRPKVTTKYFLMVTDAFDCRSLVPDVVEVLVTPTVKIFAGNDTLVAINQPVQLNVRETGNAGVTQYTWTPPDFLSNPNIANPVAVFPTPVSNAPYEYTYVVRGTTADGCEGFDEIRIKVYKGPDIYVPTAFTPNNDGRNDVLKAIPVGIKDFKFFRVFNRWGQVVFSTKDPSQAWNGRLNGPDQPTGTYIWIAEGVDYTGKVISRKGTVTIVR